MSLTVDRVLAWLTGFAVVFSLYAHTFTGLDSSAVTPKVAAAIAVGLISMSGLWLINGSLSVPQGAAAWSAVCLFVASWGLWVIYGLFGFQEKPPTGSDIGLLSLTVGAPILLYCNRNRWDLLCAVAWCCVAFALIDAVANTGALAGFWALQDSGDRDSGFGSIRQYAGLSGNRQAAGVVGFIAVTFLSSRVRSSGPLALSFTIFALVSIGISLWIVNARRYIGEAAIAALLLILPIGRRFPLPIAAIGTGVLGLVFTFQSLDGENIQRGDLMAAGWRESFSHITTGEGIFYRSIDGNDFNSLWTAHVTESGLIDLAIEFSWISTVLFVLSCLVALAIRRRNLNWPVVMLAMITGEMAYGDPLNGFVGAVMFFGALGIAIFDQNEIRTDITTRNNVAQRIKWNDVPTETASNI